MILSKWPSVFTASGVRGFEGEGYWYHRLWKPFGLDFRGTCFVAKTTTFLQRIGNMALDSKWRPAQLVPKCIVVKPLQGVVLNSVGLSGPGADCLIKSWLKNDTQRIERVGSQWMISFMSVAVTSQERMRQAKLFFAKLPPLIEANGKEKIGLQINLSCPNVGLDPKEMLSEVQETLDSARQLGILTLIKLNALVPVEVGIELASHEACDGIVMSNTIPWGKLPEQIDWKRLFGSTKSPLESLGGGGLSGWPLREIVGDWVHAARDHGFTKYLIAGGGILSERDVGYMFDQGASGIELGSVAILRPWRVKGMIRQALKHSPVLC